MTALLGAEHGIVPGMQTARDIYTHYRVPPWLQKHQTRVAAVGKMVARQQPGIDEDLVIATCLLHDVGAIVKFDFSYTTHTSLRSLCPDEDVPYWVGVQADVRARYGEREHEATDAILKEIGREDVRTAFNAMGLLMIPKILERDDREVQAAQYADMRVGPFGILSIQDRLAEGTARYQDSWMKENFVEKTASFPPDMDALEKRLFARMDLRPEDITDATIAPSLDELWDYAIA